MTQESEEWGPWVKYQGEGYFVGVSRGMMVQVRAYVDGVLFVSEPQIVQDAIMFSKIVEGENEKIDAFRIRKPRALQQLRDIAQGIKQVEDA